MSKGVFSLPVALLQGFMEDAPRKAVNCICYGAYSAMLQYMEDTGFGKQTAVRHIFEDFGLDTSKTAIITKTGEKCRAEIAGALSPNVEVSSYDLSPYQKERPKEDFVVLLAYLAVKSILGIRPYSRIPQNLLLSRMCGEGKAIPFEDMPKEIGRYASRKLSVKLRERLWSDFRVATFTQKGKRGCYYSTRYTPQQLADKVMGKRSLLHEALAEARTNRQTEDDDTEFQTLF